MAPSHKSIQPTTEYIELLLELDKIPRTYVVAAYISTWSLLAGYLVFPGTFTSIANSQALTNDSGQVGKAIAKTFRNLELLIIAAISCVLGAGVIVFLMWKKRNNCLWLLNKVIL